LVRDVFHNPCLRQINQRIAVRYRLSPISMEETRAYIAHVLQVTRNKDEARPARKHGNAPF